MPAALEAPGDAFAFDFGNDFSACFPRPGVSGRGDEIGDYQAGSKQTQKDYFIGLVFSCSVGLVHIKNNNCSERFLQPPFGLKLTSDIRQSAREGSCASCETEC